MPARAATFKQIDVTRAVKGVLAAGLTVGSARIDTDGSIIVVTKREDDDKSPNPCDRLLSPSSEGET